MTKVKSPASDTQTHFFHTSFSLWPSLPQLNAAGVCSMCSEDRRTRTSTADLKETARRHSNWFKPQRTNIDEINIVESEWLHWEKKWFDPKCFNHQTTEKGVFQTAAAQSGLTTGKLNIFLKSLNHLGSCVPSDGFPNPITHLKSTKWSWAEIRFRFSSMLGGIRGPLGSSGTGSLNKAFSIYVSYLQNPSTGHMKSAKSLKKKWTNNIFVCCYFAIN